MANKEIEALFELYESEKNYVFELNIWCVSLKRAIKFTPIFDNIKATYLNNLFFCEMSKILKVHTCLLEDFNRIFPEDKYKINEKNINDLLINVYNVFIEFVKQINVYNEYLMNLPRIDFFFDYRYKNDKEFNIFVSRFLQKNGIDKLGYKHFIYKPAFKLVRYPLLLEGLVKRINVLEIKDNFIKILNDIKNFNSQSEIILGEAKNDFRLYQFREILRNRLMSKSVPNLFLWSRKRKIFDERDLFVKINSLINNYRVIVLDNYILFCDVVVMQDENEMIYLKYYIEQFKYLYKVLGEENELNRYSIELHDFNEEEKILIYFKHQRDMINWLNSFDISVRSTLKFFDKKIKILEESELPLKDIKLICTPYIYEKMTATKSINYTVALPPEKNFFKNIAQFCNKKNNLDSLQLPDQSINGEDMYKYTSAFRNFFSKAQIIEHVISFEKLPNLQIDGSLKIIANPSGTFMMTNNEYKNISSIIPKDMIYALEPNVLILLVDNSCVVSPLNSNSSSLDIYFVRKNISKFFYIYLYDMPYIFMVELKNAESRIFYYEITEFNNTIRMILRGEFYVPSQVVFLEALEGSNLIVVSEIFTCVNINSTIIKEISVNDEIIKICYFSMIEKPEGKKILHIGDGNFILCYKNFGYVVSSEFKIFNSSLFYAWDESAHDFKIFGKYLVVLGNYCIYVFDLSNSLLVFYDCSNNYYFLKNSKKPQIHDNTKIYDLILPE